MRSLIGYGSALLLLSITLGITMGASPSIVCTPNRTSGVAPLAVFLDCSSTTDADLTAYATEPFHGLLYQHTFGDSTAGVYGDKPTGSGGAKTGDSRNLEWGPLAGHVYETPGTYTITTLVRDGTSTVRSVANTITVDDPNTIFSGTATVCFYNATVGTGCPSGATQTLSSDFDAALNSCIGTTKRCLFKRGDTFTASAASIINVTGPGIIGAYGSGNKPLIQGIATFVPQVDMSEADGLKNLFIQLSSSATPDLADWRIMDLEMDGQSNQAAMAIAAKGGMNQITILNVNCHHMGTTCLSLNDSIIQVANGAGVATPHDIWDQVAVVDSSFTNITHSGHINLYASVTRFMLLGSDVSIGTNEIVRFPYLVKGILGHNFLAYSDKNHVLKLHGPTFGSSLAIEGDVPSKLIVISDNKIIGDDGSPAFGNIDAPVAIGPQNNTSDERVQDVIYERNYTVGSSTTQFGAIFYGVARATIRNNLCDLTIALGVDCFSIVQRGIEPAPTDIWLYNNTMYSAKVETVNEMVFVSLGSTALNITAKNNLAYTPNAGGLNSYLVFGTGAGTPTASNNSTDRTAGVGHQMKAVSPLFDDVSTLKGFRIGTGSYGATGGTAVFPSSYDDFFHCSNGKTSDNHEGAFVPRTRARCSSASLR